MELCYQNVWDLIEKYFVKCLDKNDHRLPSATCDNCMVIVYEYGRGIFERKIKLFNYSKVFHVITRQYSLGKSCLCIVCSLGSSVVHNNFEIGKATISKRSSVGGPKKLPDIEESLELLSSFPKFFNTPMPMTLEENRIPAQNRCVTNIKELVFNGNDCKKLLQHTHLLIDKLHCLYPEFVTALNDFNAVVNSLSFCKLNIRITPKLHAIFFHISDFCEENKSALSIWSEQASESVHANFKKTWAKYAVTEVNKDEYGQQLLKAIQYYASKHI
ncbi:hypothetical protein A3Q56_07319 [Intoshia linei]|uniref:Uncharacterized protein n=1 Tax=Intoshia linei TaxID=1819745 RepID=A0A177ASJ3_9BILA|nr:hypothetical protein A3Q56_07319 [Intoshia linei]